MQLRDYKELSVSNLSRYEGNSRTHSIEQVKQIVNSIKEFGFTNPLLVDEENNIIAGHGRLEAAIKLKLEKVPCIVLDNLTAMQKRAYVIADNKLALNAGWDNELLKTEFDALEADGFDLALTGFDADELKDLFNDDIEITPAEPNDEEYKSVFEIVVECENENEQERIYKECSSKGYKCRILSM